MEENKTKAKIIAVAGKGGVGKTSLCSAIVRELVEAFPGKRILAIDADPACPRHWVCTSSTRLTTSATK